MAIHSEKCLGAILCWQEQTWLWSADEELRQKFNAPMKLVARMPPTTLEELELRDNFFRQLHEELSCKMDGTDLVEEIPDIDLEE